MTRRDKAKLLRRVKERDYSELMISLGGLARAVWLPANVCTRPSTVVSVKVAVPTENSITSLM